MPLSQPKYMSESNVHLKYVKSGEPFSSLVPAYVLQLLTLSPHSDYRKPVEFWQKKIEGAVQLRCILKHTLKKT